MGFSKEWEDCYRSNSQMSVWPWSDLVSYVMRYARPLKENVKVLELGCGAGANILFFKKLGLDYYGIDGSDYIINELKQKFPEYKNNLISGDFTEDLFFKTSFDLIVDRAAITHNSTKSIVNCLSMIYERLDGNGKFIGIDWFSTSHSDFNIGSEFEDKYTKHNFQEGQFLGVGKVHFSDKEHLTDLLSNFKIIVLEHKKIKKEIPNDNHIFASWNFVVEKK